MINAKNISMYFDKYAALKNLSCTIPKGCIYGLIGSNGAGKSTFLRLISGVYRPNEGEITIDGEKVFNNPTIKEKIAFVPDDLYFLPGAGLNEMVDLYKSIYKNFNTQRFYNLASTFQLPANRPIAGFSKGMKRQASTILALSSMPDYLFFDETFDGLDPVMRNLVKQVIYNDISERNTTVIITSHSLRELEDTCDQLALLHLGGIVFESDIQDLKTAMFKIQIGFNEPFGKEKFNDINIVSYTQQGSVACFIVRGDKAETENTLRMMNPAILDILPLNLEEVFIYEMETLGYSFKDIIM